MKKHRKTGNWKSRSSRLVAVGTLAVSAVTGNHAFAGTGSGRAKQDQQAASTTFDIGPGPLQSVLEQWKKAAGVSLAIHIPPETLTGFHSSGVRGALSNEAALQQILQDTGLGYHPERNGTRFEIQIQNAEQVSVTASSNSVGLGQFTESLTDTPQTVNVVPQFILQEQAVTSLRDSLRNAPASALPRAKRVRRETT